MGCAMAEGLLRLFIAIAPANIPYLNQIRLDLRIVSVAILLSILCGALFAWRRHCRSHSVECWADALLPPSLMRPCDSGWSSRRSPQAWSCWRQQCSCCVASAILKTRILACAPITRSPPESPWISTFPHARSKLNFFQQLTTPLRFGPGVTRVAVSDPLPPGGGGMGGRLDEIAIEEARLQHQVLPGL